MPDTQSDNGKYKIYVASSWRNQKQPVIVERLRKAGFAVYDFRNPCPHKHGFSWSEIDPNWKSWSPDQFRMALNSRIAQNGFAMDWHGMQWADACVLVLPSGRSAHIEAGYFVGANKPLYILNEEAQEPELMYRMACSICISIDELLNAIVPF